MALTELKGRPLGTQKVIIERGPIRVFAQALMDNDPVYNADAAPVPPTFPFVMSYWGSLGTGGAAGLPIERLRGKGRAILHGEQWLSEKYRRSATTYYKTTSGIGRTLLAFEGKAIRVGVIGLGAGSVAVYGDGDDVYRFYDINPAVVGVAKKWFTFLADSPAKIEIVKMRPAR